MTPNSATPEDAKRTRRVRILTVCLIVAGVLGGLGAMVLFLHPEQITDLARGLAAFSVLSAWVSFTFLTKWWRNPALAATWCLFTGLLAVLALAVSSRYDWYPKDWKPWLTSLTWLFVAGLFIAWTITYLREQFADKHAIVGRRRDVSPVDPTVKDVQRTDR